MAYNTAILQGSFTSNGTSRDIVLRSDVDWMRVYNQTALTQATADLAYEFYWQRGFAQGGGFGWTKLGTVANDPVTVGALAANTGFFLIDSSITLPGAAIAATAITNVIQPVVATANTGSLVTGSIVRLERDTALPNLMGFDFEVDTVVANTSFTMRYPLANAPGAAGAGDGFYRHIPFDPIFYPRHRFVINISNAVQAVVTTSVSHGYTIGQEVRMRVPSSFGMTQINDVHATIVAVTPGTFTLNVDSTAFTAFAFPDTTANPALYPFDWAQVIPMGQDTGVSLTQGVDILADATRNTAFLGMRLMGGAGSPGGANNDIMYWIAGKSFSVDNQ